MFFKVKTIATLLDISKDFYSNFVAVSFVAVSKLV